MKLNKLGASILLAGIVTGSSFAMEMMATGTMMKHDNMKATGSVMKHSDMLLDMKDLKDGMIKATGTMTIKKEMMVKCLDEKKATKAEIKKFQKENGLDQVGIMGKKTKAKLAMLGCKKEVKVEMMDMKKERMMDKMDDKMMKASTTMMHN